MKHPDAPLFPLKRTYRLVVLAAVSPICYAVQFRTWFGRWKTISGVYLSRLAAEAEMRSIQFGLPDWMPIADSVCSGRERIRGHH